MNIQRPIRIQRFSRPKPFVIGCACALAAMLPGMAHAVTDLSGIPLYALEGVAPNIALTIDDSGSMGWGAVPDAKVVSDSGKRWISSSYNAMYYNPRTLYRAPPDENGTPRATSFTRAWINGFDSTRGSIDLSTGYRATLRYYPNNTTQTLQTAPAGNPHYALLDLSNTGCDSTAKDAYGAFTDNDCYDAITVGTAADITSHDLDNDGDVDATDKKQNFANWYSFYRTRNLATMSAASLAFRQLSPEFRVGYQNLWTCPGFSTTCKDRSGNTYDSRISVFDGTPRTNFFKWLQRSNANNGTPLLRAAERAGEMFKTDRPWEKVPGSVANPKYECRGNYSIVMTDGIWNTSYANNVGDFDNTSHALPDGQNYSPKAPYVRSNTDNNMADIALKYWATDLRPDLPSSSVLAFYNEAFKDKDETFGGNVFTPYWNPKNDPATWQHMVTYTIGLGLSGTLSTDWDPSVGMYGGAYASFMSGTAWPGTGIGADPGNVYDLWHAAINGRGRFYSAESPDDVVKAFEEIIGNIQDRQGSAVAASISGSRITGDTYVYQTSFNTSDWSGNLRAFGISDGSNTGGCSNTPRGTVCSGEVWDAASKLDALNWDSGRQIVTNAGGAGKAFRWTNLTAPQQTALMSGGTDTTLGQQRLEFLRGSRTLEGTTMRKRSSVMGDIINSAPAPLFVGAPDFYYPGDAAYKTFQSTYQNRRKMIYAGANDGMLHAFDAMTGVEVFAFIPNAVYPNLYKLTQPDYKHQSYVDGGMVAYDLKISGAYKSYLFGGLGLGGKAVYALDITDPTQFSEGKASSIFRWEFTHANLGYTYGKPKVIKLAGDVTALVFGSGYMDGAQAASLFVVNAATGALIANIPVPTSDGTTTFTDNGITGITPVDTQGKNTGDLPDGIVDAVYAGDLYGNMWKFDFTSPSPTLAYKGKPMFIARDPTGKRQPITTEPAVSRHPTGNGVMVYFGTGKYLGASDTTTSQIQTFYAIWNKDRAHNTGILRSHLLEQEIIKDYTGQFTNTHARTTTDKPIYWHDTDDDTLPAVGYQLGWYLDLDTESRERVHQSPFVRGDRVIFVTVTPSDNPCSAGGNSWIYEMQAVSGARLKNTTPWDYNQDGLFDDKDKIPEGTDKLPGTAIRFSNFDAVYYLDKESILLDGDRDLKMVSTSNTNVGVVAVGESASASNRRTWRELIAE